MTGCYQSSDEIVERGFITLLEAMGGALEWSWVVVWGVCGWLLACWESLPLMWPRIASSIVKFQREPL